MCKFHRVILNTVSRQLRFQPVVKCQVQAFVLNVHGLNVQTQLEKFNYYIAL